VCLFWGAVSALLLIYWEVGTLHAWDTTSCMHGTQQYACMGHHIMRAWDTTCMEHHIR
jgi:hypothetical protein